MVIPLTIAKSVVSVIFKLMAKKVFIATNVNVVLSVQ